MRSDCRICHSQRLELILKLAPTPIGDEFLLAPKHQPLHPIDLYQCQDCGLAQLLYEIPPEEIYRDYLYLTGSSVGLDKHFHEYALRAIQVCGLKPGDLVIDIGSNDGTLLKHFKAAGMEVNGYEPCQQIAAIARAADIHTVAAYFDHRQPDFGVTSRGHYVKPKLITANNVVANINDLDSFMQGVVKLLHPEGTFVFESFYLGDVVKNMVFDFIYHEHLSAFSVRSVKRLMRRFGLNLFRVEHLPTKGGSIRYYCKRYYACRGAPEVADDDEALYQADTYKRFAQRIDAEKARMQEFLITAREHGRTICGFGASISATTLIYHFGMGEFLHYLIDDNPAKQGRLSPGLHLPVYPISEAYVRGPDYVIALAWRFAGDFRARHPHFKLVVPLPHFHIEAEYG